MSTVNPTIRRPARLSDLPGEIRDAVGYLLHRASLAATRSIGDVLAPLGLEVKHYAVLCTLQRQGSQPQGCIGDRLGIDRTTMVQLVDDLEQRELVVRQRNPHDRRSYALTITPAGVETWRRARRRVERWEREFLEALEPEEHEQLRSLLARLVRAHEDTPA